MNCDYLLNWEKTNLQTVSHIKHQKRCVIENFKRAQFYSADSSNKGICIPMKIPWDVIPISYIQNCSHGKFQEYQTWMAIG